MTTESAQTRFDKAFSSYQTARTPEGYQLALDIFSELLEETGDLTKVFRHSSMFFCAECLRQLDRPREADPLLRTVLREADLEPDLDRGLIAAVRLSLAEVLRDTDLWQEAIDVFLASTAYFREKGDWRSEANVHRTVAQHWQEHHQLDQADSAFKTAWSILKEYEPTPLHLQVLFARGHCRFLMGDVESAIELEERALAVARQLDDNATEAQLVSNLAELTFGVQDFQRATHYNAWKLQEARAANDSEVTARCLTILGACYSETARSRQAVEAFDEAQALLSSLGQGESVEAGMCMLGTAQSLVDMKRYDDAALFLTTARDLLARTEGDCGLLDRIEHRLLRETKSPMAVDCAHRILRMVLAGSSRGTSHHNPQPDVDLTRLQQYLTSDLTEEDRERFAGLRAELNADLFQTKYSPSHSQYAPGGLMVPLKFEYVDEVEAFEIKWAAYKRELDYTHESSELQKAWDKIRHQFSHAEGVFRGVQLELLDYISNLLRIAEVCAELGARELFGEVALHAADFLEMETSDPMVAVLIWLWRGQLMIAAHTLAKSDCRELAEVELRRSLNQVQAVYVLLGNARRKAALDDIVETWFRGASVLGREGYAGLVNIVEDLQGSLNIVDRIRYGIAVGEARGTEEGVRMVDALVAEVRAENPDARITLAPEFEIALAVQRFKALAPDFKACRCLYGPFAQYLHSEVRGWTSDASVPSESERPTSGVPILAFTDANLVVIDKRLEGVGYAASILHEAKHQGRRSGQMKRTDDGDWLLVKRDVPTASAVTYFLLLQAEDKSDLGDLVRQIEPLVSIGQRAAEADAERSTVYINNMLRYFDDLGMHESGASYPCAAILLGMAFGFLRDPDCVMSYLDHLDVMDHEEALRYGRRKATLWL
jgi:tetratricopeptide (TPR) repeat protein